VRVYHLLGLGYPPLLLEVVRAQQREVVVGVDVVEGEDQVDQGLAAAWEGWGRRMAGVGQAGAAWGVWAGAWGLRASVTAARCMLI